jgi:protein-S-isoprenylcysteine O-methyltransferase Ste14
MGGGLNNQLQNRKNVMNVNTSVNGSRSESDIKAGIKKRAAQLVVQILVIGALLFVSSGRLDWVMAWVYIGIYVVGIAINSAILLQRNPELIAERAEMGAGTKRWDKTIATLYVLMSSIGTLLIAGLDVRFGWSPEMPLTIRVIGLVAMATGFALASWAMLSNAFFAGTVRIQDERGHVVATGGPYRFVRHPGYVGWLLAGIATPLMLGSVWALIPAGMATILLIVRTALEDQTLREELDGYYDYTRQVRYRLVPGIW